MPATIPAVEALLEHRPVARYKNGKKKTKTKGAYEYLVRWAGTDPRTGAPWPPSWEATEHIDTTTLEAYYAAELARRPPARPRGARVAKPPFRWPAQPGAETAASPTTPSRATPVRRADTAALGPFVSTSPLPHAGRARQTTPSPVGNDHHAPLADTATLSPPFGSSPPLPHADRTGHSRLKKPRWSVPSHRSDPADGPSTRVSVAKQPALGQEEPAPTPRQPPGRARREAVPKIMMTWDPAGALLITSSPAPSTTTATTASMTPRSHSTVDGPDCETTTKKKMYQGLAGSSPKETPPRKRRRICDMLRQQAPSLEG